MKMIKFICLAIISVMIVNSAAAQKNGEQLTIPLSEPGKPYKLHVHLMNGPITVVVYDGKDIIMDAQAGEENDKEEKQSSNGMRRIPAGNSMDLTAEERNNTVTINSNSMMKLVKLSLKVPRGLTDLNLGSINNGTIEVTDATGDIEISTVTGSIKLTNVSGSVVANTISGNVIVTFKSIDANAPMAFSALSGNVDVTFPSTLKADLKLKTDRGEMLTDFDIAINKAQPATKRTGDGMTKLKFDDWVRGKINGGGAEMMMKTMTGNIYIRKAK